MKTSIPWLRVFAEGAVIVVSILLAFGIDAAWDERQERADERALLEDVRATLGEDLEGVRQELGAIESVADRLRTLIGQLEDGVPIGADLPEHQAVISGLDRFVVVKVRYGPFETLKARGLDLISDQELRVRLTSLYEDAFPQLIENSEIDQRLSREQVLPFQLDHLELASNGAWLARDRSPATQSVAVTLARYRLRTLNNFYLPSFYVTIEQIEQVLEAIDSQLVR